MVEKQVWGGEVVCCRTHKKGKGKMLLIRNQKKKTKKEEKIVKIASDQSREKLYGSAMMFQVL